MVEDVRDTVLPDDEAQDDEPRGIFMRLAPGGSAGTALSAGLGSIDAVFNPAAARAREALDRQHERVVPTPSPGDRMLDTGIIVIDAPVESAD